VLFRSVGGGVAAFAVVSGNHKPGPGPGSGSQIANKDPGVVKTGPGGKDAAVALAPDAADIAAVVPDAAVEHTLPTEMPDAGAAGGNTLPPSEVPQVQVLLFARNAKHFEVYENDAKLFDGPYVLPVNKGERRTVVIKAAGFRDKQMVVDSTKDRVQFALVRIPGAIPGPGPGHGSNTPIPGTGSATVPVNPNPNPGNPGPGSGHVYTPNPPPDCSTKIVDPRSKACVDQYCAKHPDEDKCHMM